MELLSFPRGEIWLYYSFADHLQNHLLPYKGFFPEYPPLSLIPFWIAGLMGSQWFTIVYYLLIGVFLLLTSWLIHRLGKNPYIFLASVLSLGGLLWDRFDIFPAFLSLWAVYFWYRKKEVAGSFVLSLAILTKIYPMVLIPLFWKRKNVAKKLLAFILPIAVVYLVVTNYGGSFNKLLEFQGKRGLEIEAIRATPKLLQHLWQGKPVTVEYLHNSYEIK